MRISILVVLLGALLTAPALATTTAITSDTVPSNATLITFETDPSGNVVPLETPAGNIWTPLGVTFDSDVIVGDPVGGAFLLVTPPNVLSGTPIGMSFSPDVTMVGAWGFDFVLTVYDSQGHALGTSTHTDGTPGLFGGASEFGFLGFVSDVPIARAVFSYAFPNDTAFGFHIDNLSFVSVPEPVSVVLLGIGAGVLLIRRRRVGAQ